MNHDRKAREMIAAALARHLDALVDDDKVRTLADMLRERELLGMTIKDEVHEGIVATMQRLRDV